MSWKKVSQFVCRFAVINSSPNEISCSGYILRRTKVPSSSPKEVPELGLSLKSYGPYPTKLLRMKEASSKETKRVKVTT